MAERTLAKMIYDYECTLEEYKKGNIDVDVLVAKFKYLSTGVASVVSKYCDDFSCADYYKELMTLSEEKKDDCSDDANIR